MFVKYQLRSCIRILSYGHVLSTLFLVRQLPFGIQHDTSFQELLQLRLYNAFSLLSQQL